MTTKSKTVSKIVLPVEPFKDKLKEFLKLIGTDAKTEFMQGDLPTSYWPVDSTLIVHEYPGTHGDDSNGPEFSVWEFREGSVSYTYKFSGQYSSYSGSQFYSYKEVQPVTKTVTLWE